MKRGFEAVLAEQAPISWPSRCREALKAIGMTLVMKVGGASGPLYGTLFMTLGKELPAEPTVADAGARPGRRRSTALKARGKADLGNKTMLDVLGPRRRASRLRRRQLRERARAGRRERRRPRCR